MGEGFQVPPHEQNYLLVPSRFAVLGRGLEPPPLARPAPKAGASTNFATPARVLAQDTGNMKE